MLMIIGLILFVISSSIAFLGAAVAIAAEADATIHRLRVAEATLQEDYANAKATIAQLREELAGVRAVVEKLPKYADTGEPFIPSRNKVWMFFNSPDLAYIGPYGAWRYDPPDSYTNDDGTVVSCGDEWVVVVPCEYPEDGSEIFGGPFYSTESAAHNAIL